MKTPSGDNIFSNIIDLNWKTNSFQNKKIFSARKCMTSSKLLSGGMKKKMFGSTYPIEIAKKQSLQFFYHQAVKVINFP